MTDNQYDPDSPVSSTRFVDDLTTVSANYLNSLVPVLGNVWDGINVLEPGELCVIDDSKKRAGQNVLGAAGDKFEPYHPDGFVDMACDGRRLLILSRSGAETYVRIYHYDKPTIGPFDIALPAFFSVNPTASIDSNGTHWAVAYNDDASGGQVRMAIYDDYEGGAALHADVSVDGFALEDAEAFYVTQDCILVGTGDDLDGDVWMLNFSGQTIAAMPSVPQRRLRACNGRHALLVPNVSGASVVIDIAQGAFTNGVELETSGELNRFARVVMDHSCIYVFNADDYFIINSGFEVYSGYNTGFNVSSGPLCLTQNAIYAGLATLPITSPAVDNVTLSTARQTAGVESVADMTRDRRSCVSDGFHLFVYGKEGASTGFVRGVVVRNTSAGLCRRVGPGKAVASHFSNLPLVPC
jgi:hypothetical protein